MTKHQHSRTILSLYVKIYIHYVYTTQQKYYFKFKLKIGFVHNYHKFKRPHELVQKYTELSCPVHAYTMTSLTRITPGSFICGISTLVIIYFLITIVNHIRSFNKILKNSMCSGRYQHVVWNGEVCDLIKKGNSCMS